MVNVSVEIGNLRLKNPVLTASGTFGYGLEFTDFLDLNQLGGFIVKGTTLEPRQGNPYPRMAETPMGMLNAVGLQNVGVDKFITDIYPKIKNLDTNVVVNVSGACIDDYVAVAKRLADNTDVEAIEINISCPNVKEGGMAFGTSATAASRVTKAVRETWDRTMIVKLSPNVTDITEIARAVESEGADAVSLINTLLGMAIDVERQKPVLSTMTGGLSGPAIKPVALRMVWQVAKAIKIPIIGIGGICSASDALEFIMAGATAVQIGTANFVNPAVTMDVIEGIKEYCLRKNISDVNDLRGII